MQLGAYLTCPHVRCFEYTPYRCFRPQPSIVGSMLTSSPNQEYATHMPRVSAVCSMRWFAGRHRYGNSVPTSSQDIPCGDSLKVCAYCLEMMWLDDGSCLRLRPERANHVWSYDFVSTMTHDSQLLTATVSLLSAGDSSVAGDASAFHVSRSHEFWPVRSRGRHYRTGRLLPTLAVSILEDGNKLAGLQGKTPDGFLSFIPRINQSLSAPARSLKVRDRRSRRSRRTRLEIWCVIF